MQATQGQWSVPILDAPTTPTLHPLCTSPSLVLRRKLAILQHQPATLLCAQFSLPTKRAQPIPITASNLDQETTCIANQLPQQSHPSALRPSINANDLHSVLCVARADLLEVDRLQPGPVLVCGRIGAQ